MGIMKIRSRRRISVYQSDNFFATRKKLQPFHKKDNQNDNLKDSKKIMDGRTALSTANMIVHLLKEPFISTLCITRNT
jgi:hypothetical protein